MKLNKQSQNQLISDKSKEKYIKEIIGYFQDERDEKIGRIAAESILDFFLATIGKEVYRKSIKDCQKLLEESFDDIKLELDLLQ